MARAGLVPALPFLGYRSDVILRSVCALAQNVPSLSDAERLYLRLGRGALAVSRQALQSIY